MDAISLIVIGIYTVVNIIVFIIQQNQIKSQKGIIESMSKFTEIFNVDEVRKFVEMREETAKGSLENMIKNDPRVLEMIDKLLFEHISRIEQKHRDELESKYFELCTVVLEFMKGMRIEDREQFVKDHLSINKEGFLPMLAEIESFQPENPVYGYNLPQSLTDDEE